MLDLSPIASAIKTLQQPPPQVMPLVAKAMKPVRDAETLAAVPPPVKSGRPGLGEHMDLYDTDAEAFAAMASGDDEMVPDPAPPIELPFLKPLGAPLGKSIDAKV
jgi:hypothetical protein